MRCVRRPLVWFDRLQQWPGRYPEQFSTQMFSLRCPSCYYHVSHFSYHLCIRKDVSLNTRDRGAACRPLPAPTATSRHACTLFTRPYCIVCTVLRHDTTHTGLTPQVCGVGGCVPSAWCPIRPGQYYKLQRSAAHAAAKAVLTVSRLTGAPPVD